MPAYAHRVGALAKSLVLGTFTRARFAGLRKGSARQCARSGLVAAVAIVTLASAACASMSVNRIISDPTRYRDREVQLSGEVVDSYSLANRGIYRIDDGTGRLWVVSDRGVPRRNSRVTVKGRVREGFNFGSLGERINLPSDVGVGLVLMESSHRAR